jgi:hypothetical protein
MYSVANTTWFCLGLFVFGFRAKNLSSDYLQMNQHKSKRFSNQELWLMQDLFESEYMLAPGLMCSLGAEMQSRTKYFRWFIHN